MSITLYETPPSPPCRAVLVTAEALGLKLNRKVLDLSKNEQYSPEFVKINPQHTVPTLVDSDGTVLWDSHVIATYLVEKYAKDDSLYPKDLVKRALVDQKLHFDGASVFSLFKRTVFPLLFLGRKVVAQDSIDEAIRVYEFLEKFLENHKWIAGDSITLADYCLIPNVASLAAPVPIDEKKFPKLTSWIKRGQELPEFAVNAPGQKLFNDLIAAALS